MTILSSSFPRRESTPPSAAIAVVVVAVSDRIRALADLVFDFGRKTKLLLRDAV